MKAGCVLAGRAKTAIRRPMSTLAPSRDRVAVEMRSMAVQINRGRALGLLDLTPMMDMVFNLLIFFMVVTQFEKSERDLKVLLPDGSRSDADDRQAAGDLHQHRSGRAVFCSQPAARSPKSSAKLLTQAALNNPANQSVVIRADKRAAWDYVATAMRLCNQAGIRDYSASLADEP